MGKNKLTAEQAAKIEQFQDHFDGFDWSYRDGIEKDWVALMHESLDAAGFDFSSIDHIDRFLNDVIQPFWNDMARQEEELTEQARDLFRAAGATEAQLNWGMVDHVRLTRKGERKLAKISRKLDEVRASVLPIVGLAAALNEARAKLTA